MLNPRLMRSWVSHILLSIFLAGILLSLPSPPHKARHRPTPLLRP